MEATAENLWPLFTIGLAHQPPPALLTYPYYGTFLWGRISPWLEITGHRQIQNSSFAKRYPLHTFLYISTHFGINFALQRTMFNIEIIVPLLDFILMHF